MVVYQPNFIKFIADFCRFDIILVMQQKMYFKTTVKHVATLFCLLSTASEQLSCDGTACLFPPFINSRVAQHGSAELKSK